MMITLVGTKASHVHNLKEIQMFGALMRAFTQWFTVVMKFGVVAENVAIATENLSIVAVETSGAYVDESRAERAKKRAALEADLAEESAASAKRIKAAA